MRRLLFPISASALAVAVPVLSFMAFGAALESRLESTVQEIVDPSAAAALIVVLLSTDVFLPVPSSVLSTLGGEVLGFIAGTAASFTGLMLGALLGFTMARIAGRPLMRRFAAREDIQRMEQLNERMGTMVLIVTRPVPVFAEAAVLFFGATGLPWRRFLLPVASVNLAVAAAYSALGRWVHLPVALTLSIVVPVLAAWLARRATGPPTGR